MGRLRHPPARTRARAPDLGLGPTTRILRAGRRLDYNAGALVPPIYQTSTFHYPSEFSEAQGIGRTYLYTRHENPTQEVAAEPIRDLEGAEAARVFASGMGAISSTLLTFLRAGEEIVALEDLYGGTLELLTRVLPRLGVRLRWIPSTDAGDPEKAVGGAARLVYIETPTNPLLRVHDIARWAKAAHRAGALLVVDNTFATPVNQTPLAFGADLVVHSATKYLSGHSDVVAGAVAGPEGLVRDIGETHRSIGASLDPFAAFLLARGLKTLPLRIARQNETGRIVTEALRSHPAISRVHYPGSAGPAEEGIVRAQMKGRGGVVALSLSGGARAARRFLRRLRIVQVASSLGGVESLASIPGETSHRSLTRDERRGRGIDDGLVRISLGVEEPDDLLSDISQALMGS